MSQFSTSPGIANKCVKALDHVFRDIKGASLEAGPIQKKFRPLYMHQPRGGIPGLDPQDVIEITGNIYGSNDAPF